MTFASSARASRGASVRRGSRKRPTPRLRRRDRSPPASPRSTHACRALGEHVRGVAGARCRATRVTGRSIQGEFDERRPLPEWRDAHGVERDRDGLRAELGAARADVGFELIDGVLQALERGPDRRSGRTRPRPAASWRQAAIGRRRDARTGPDPAARRGAAGRPTLSLVASSARPLRRSTVVKARSSACGSSGASRALQRQRAIDVLREQPEITELLALGTERQIDARDDAHGYPRRAPAAAAIGGGPLARETPRRDPRATARRRMIRTERLLLDRECALVIGSGLAR